MTEVVEVAKNVPVSSLMDLTALPDEMRQQVEIMATMGVTLVDVASVATAAGYKVVVIPSGEEEDEGEEEESESESEESENGDGDEDEYEDEDEDEDEGERVGLVGLLDRLRVVFGKGVSFEAENRMIARNRKRAAARSPHEFQRATWATRKGVVRCRVCGGPQPGEGQLCAAAVDKNGYMPGMEEPAMSDVGELTVRSAAYAHALDLIVDAVGPFSQDEAHYMEPSPFADEGLLCANCVAYCPEIAGCYWVSGGVEPEGVCRLWVIPTHSMYGEMRKEVISVDGQYCVQSKDGSRSFGCYDNRSDAEARLAQIERFSKAETYAPPKGVREEAKRALNWIAEGHAGRNFTDVGRKRASDLAAGRSVSLDTIKRIRSYLARHEVDKRGEGFSPGEPGYPSAGRVAWAAWGGDPAIAWTNGILDGVDKGSPDINSVHVDRPIGSDRRRRTGYEMGKAAVSDIKVGSWVAWDSSGGTARGRVERIVTNGTLRVPDSSFSFEGSGEEPAILIRLWRRTADGWRPTEQRVGHRAGTLRLIESLVKDAGLPWVFTKADERRFTLGPWYVPDQYDAHGEWTDSDELQAALWDYVRKGERTIMLQHDTEVAAGEWVEALTWPYPVTVPLYEADTGRTVDHEFPANTVFLGVVWEPWAWELVKAGKIRGYSIGGRGERVAVDMEMNGSQV